MCNQLNDKGIMKDLRRINRLFRALVLFYRGVATAWAGTVKDFYQFTCIKTTERPKNRLGVTGKILNGK